ncbi:type III pantothenate kinase [Gynuella sunshinyii]|uniref:Type III pantothenate kinase n=1 Tax=Gynuella sunshinyii YC6258 TaxID=1445510 RepID=A0A0C5VSE5_9GAMM|nr:type III pantothenate kinase [Gynuella sunshinyii]AJQ97607.1 putative transcriptional regulator, Bvg accessory factor-like protein [Gynuella sunshinyii YC6258]
MAKAYLDLDIGNTFTKFQGYGGLGHLSGRFRNSDFRQIELMFGQEVAGQSVTVRLAAVGDIGHFDRIVSMLDRYAVKWYRVTSELLTDYIQLAYQDVTSIGVDRVLNMIAINHIYPKRKYIIVSVGTALTIDLLANGKHLGGYILQSPESQLKSFPAVANLPSLDIGEDVSLNPGSNTEDCMRSGVMLSAIAALEYISLKHKGYDVTITGGGAAQVSSLLSCSHQLEENLVLKGMSFIHRGCD